MLTHHRRTAREFLSAVTPCATVVIFHRYSQRAKTLLEAYDLKPAAKIVEVDIRGTWT